VNGVAAGCDEYDWEVVLFQVGTHQVAIPEVAKIVQLASFRVLSAYYAFLFLNLV